MEEYSEAILPKIGLRRREFMVVLMKMERPGYFLWIMNPNSKLNNKANTKRYTIITNG
jgi:hypothetical protein